MSQIEVIHEADHTGRSCERCPAEIAGPKAEAYTPGDRVVVIDGDPLASWRTLRSVTCTASVAKPWRPRRRAA
jgi:hypothetical protein